MRTSPTASAKATRRAAIRQIAATSGAVTAIDWAAATGPGLATAPAATGQVRAIVPAVATDRVQAIVQTAATARPRDNDPLAVEIGRALEIAPADATMRLLVRAAAEETRFQIARAGTKALAAAVAAEISTLAVEVVVDSGVVVAAADSEVEEDEAAAADGAPTST